MDRVVWNEIYQYIGHTGGLNHSGNVAYIGLYWPTISTMIATFESRDRINHQKYGYLRYQVGACINWSLDSCRSTED